MPPSQPECYFYLYFYAYFFRSGLLGSWDKEHFLCSHSQHFFVAWGGFCGSRHQSFLSTMLIYLWIDPCLGLIEEAMLRLHGCVFFGISRRHSCILSSHFLFLSRRVMHLEPTTIRFHDIYSLMDVLWL